MCVLALGATSMSMCCNVHAPDGVSRVMCFMVQAPDAASWGRYHSFHTLDIASRVVYSIVQAPGATFRAVCIIVCIPDVISRG